MIEEGIRLVGEIVQYENGFLVRCRSPYGTKVFQNWAEVLNFISQTVIL